MKRPKLCDRLTSRRKVPAVESLEARALTALVVVLNGNSFNAAGPSVLTADAAAILTRAGNRVVQLSNLRINSAGELKRLAAGVARLAGGQPIGLVGFSAGGALALRIAALPGVNASAVLDYYGVPDVRDYLNLHSRDHFYRPIAGLAPLFAVCRFATQRTATNPGARGRGVRIERSARSSHHELGRPARR